MIWSPHVTVAAVVEHDGRFLMVRERDGGRVVINQPAGHLEPGESLTEAAYREVLEETGYPFRPQGLVGVYLLPDQGQGATYLRFCFWGHCDLGGTPKALDVDILDTVWLSHGELKRHPEPPRSPLVLRCVDDYRNGRRFSLDILNHLLDIQS